MAETVGAIQYDVSLNTSNIKKQAQKVEQDLESSAKKSSSAISGMISGSFMAITNRAIDAVSNLTGEMMDLYDSAQKFPKVIESMGGSTNFANQAFADMKKYADDTIYSLEDMTGTFGMLYGTAGDDTIKLVKALGGVSALAEDSGKAMKSWSLQLTQMVNKPMVSWMDFKILLEQNPGAIAKIAEAMGKTTKQLIQDVSDGTQATEEFLSTFKKVGNSNDLQKMATASDNFKNSLGQLQASIVSAGLELLNVFGPVIIGGINTVVSGVDSIRNAFVGFFNYLKENQWLVDILKTLATVIAGVTGALITYKATVIAVNTVQAIFNGLLKANPLMLLTKAILVAVGALVVFFTQTETGKKIWAGFVGFLGDTIKNIDTWFKDTFNGIINWFNGINLYQAGKDMINGLVKGLSSGAGAVVNKIKEIAQGALDTIKKFFGIHSPSRVMAGIGGFMMEGWAIGMNKTSSEAIKSAKTASSKILGTFENLTSPQLGIESSISRQGFVGGSSANITNNYVVNNNADVELISIKQAQALRTA